MGKIKIAIIGAGAAGAMAGIAAAQRGASVVLFERNEKLGKKIYITGKGRCNLTNAAEGASFMEGIARHPKFLYSAFSQFSNKDLMQFMESEGLPLKVERGQRVFPLSDKSNDVNRTLENALHKRGALVQYRRKITRILSADSVSTPRFFLEDETGAREGPFDRLLLACGGKSYPTTGSDGSGYALAEALGHKVQPLFPSLVPFRLGDPFIPALEGLSLRNIALHMRTGQRTLTEFGELVFTARGISGPAVLTLSAKISAEKATRTLVLDWKPARSAEQLAARFTKMRRQIPNRALRRVYEALLPQKAIPVFEALVEVDVHKKVNSWTRQEEQKLISYLKEFPLTYLGLGDFREAVVTRGGVSLKEVNPATMESKRVPGLYLVGELLDVDGYTGGFNLQIAFSTGWVAGCCAAE
uniref:NAD(P)/FAD-dependent oxidoreductase n=1 Tax=Ndongobacter massiliensis TaxID=1871025 RepID=UPI0009309285|nr:NAD(P)/FAD-dependent oxidoreductase [Ndongobacter massiliensis]